MIAAASLQSSSLDVPTLSFVTACIAGFLGLFLIFAWMRQRDMRALAWWGSAYLIGAASIALWGAPAPLFKLPPEFAEALIFVACGMIWNGVRLFHGRRLWPLAAFAGAIVWLILSQIPGLSADSNAHIALGVIVVAIYTFFIAFELARERRKSFYSRTAAIVVPCLYAAIFLMPLAMRAFLPETFAVHWLTVLALETIIYAIGTAFIVLLMVEDHHIRVYRKAAITDHLTELLNRGAFMETAVKLCIHQGKRNEPVSLLMFDLDHFKSVNDGFGHAVGDDVLRVFARVALTSMRANDIIGRLGGEEFAAIVPESMAVAIRIAERLRAAFEVAGVTVGSHAVGATVSIGIATSYEPVTNIDALINCADNALYSAKRAGRNRLHAADDDPVGAERARQIAAARSARSATRGWWPQRKNAARPAKPVSSTASG